VKGSIGSSPTIGTSFVKQVLFLLNVCTLRPVSGAAMQSFHKAIPEGLGFNPS
jgi:hypothetical protein